MNGIVTIHSPFSSRLVGLAVTTHSRDKKMFMLLEREGDPASSEAEGEDERGETEEFPH